MKIAMLNAEGFNVDYVHGLVAALASRGDIDVDLLDSDQSLGLYEEFTNVRIFSLLGRSGPAVPGWYKVWRQIRYYGGLFWYVITTDAKVFHIQWLNRFELLERLIVVPCIGLMGKRILFTAHNVDSQARNSGRSSWLNRKTLRFMYHTIDGIIAHTHSISAELTSQFGISSEQIRVIPHGMLEPQVSRSGMSKLQARTRLGIRSDARVLLFFGNWTPYKGLDLLIEAMAVAAAADPTLHLIVAGDARNAFYRGEIESLVREFALADSVTMRPSFVPDEDLEMYFSAADCTVLPYRRISQSGVPFLSYSFGLPVIASRVGGLPEAVVPGLTGLLFEPDDPGALAQTISEYFASGLFRNLSENRSAIRNFARQTFSWEKVADRTAEMYRAFTPHAGVAASELNGSTQMGVNRKVSGCKD